MLPEPHRKPACQAETLGHSTIPGLVCADLGDPPVGSPLGDREMSWASMPEAAIDEHGDAPRTENEVWAASFLRDYANVGFETDPSGR